MGVSSVRTRNSSHTPLVPRLWVLSCKRVSEIAMCCNVLQCVAMCCSVHLWVVSCERVSEGVRGKAASSFGGNVRGLVREFGVWRIGEEIGWTVGERMGERIGERVCWRESVGCSLRE